MLEVSDSHHEFFSYRRINFDDWVRAFAEELKKIHQKALDERYEDEVPSPERPARFAELKAREMLQAKVFARKVRAHYVDDDGFYVSPVEVQDTVVDGNWIDLDPIRKEALAFSNSRFQICENLRFMEERDDGKVSVKRQISRDHPPCSACAELLQRKWMAIDEMPLIGRCACGHGCTCFFFCSSKVMHPLTPAPPLVHSHAEPAAAAVAEGSAEPHPGH